VQIGLADGIGDVRSVMRERFGDKVRLKLVPTARTGLVARLFGREPASQVSGLLDPSALIAAVEDRALWARYGL
jgi:hypothetical protein